MLMKLKSLLLSGALLIAGTAMAGITERQKPAFAADPIEPFTDNATSMYMYNVGAKKFFAAGNDWGTCASISDEGYRVYFEQFLVDGAWDGSTVYFRDSCLAKSGERKDVFFDNNSGYVYVDRGSQGNMYWKMEKGENGAYRFSMAENNPNYNDWQVAADSLGRTYFGWRANGADGTRAKAFILPTDSTCVDWTFHTVAAYNAYQQDLNVFNASESLKEVLLSAIEMGLTLTEQEAVYNNAASTIEEIDAAVVAVKAALAAAEEESVDPSAPVDKTSFIVNASFDDNKKDGWTGTSGAAGNGTYEFYEKDFDLYQVIEGLPNGVYAVSAQSYLRTGWAGDDSYNRYIKGIDNDAVLYAANGLDSLTVQVPYIYAGASTEKLGGAESEVALETGNIYIPNNMEAASIYFANPVVGPNYKRTVMIAVLDGTLKIGTRQDSHHSGYWFEMDNWTLQYYGKKGAAYTMLLENALANAPVFGDDTEATVGMVDAYNELVAGLSASTYEESVAALAALNAAVANLNENVTLWKHFKDSLALGAEMPAKGGYAGEAADALVDYAEFDGADYAEAMELTNEELKAELVKLGELIEACKRGIQEGTEIHREYLYNWDFEDTADGKNDGRGWEGEWGAYGGPSNNKCMEAYDNNWDVHQDVLNAPVGLYEVTLQGFYRKDRGNTAWDLWHNGGQVCPGEVYFNNHTDELKCVFEEPVNSKENIYSGSTSGNEGDWCQFENPELPGDSLCYPNTMTSAGEAFSAGMYKSTASGIVAKKGDPFVIGVRGKKVSATWAIWDNFRIVYWGTNAEKLLPHVNKGIEDAKANLAKNITADAYAAVSAAIATAETAAAEQDGQAMFDALVALYDSNDAVKAVVASLDSLYESAGKLFEVIAISEAPAEVIVAAENLATEVITKIDEHNITADEVASYKDQLAVMNVKLQIKGNGTDAAPESMTHLLSTPDFDLDGANSAEGWINATGSTGADDTQKSVLAYEYWRASFDMHQDLIGLPAGTYRIEVSAFVRHEGTGDCGVECYETGEIHPTAQVYAVSSNGEYCQNITPWAAGAWTEDQGITDGITSVEGLNATYYGPSNVVNSVSLFFEAGAYRNVLYANVGEDGKLCIGLRNTESDQWVVMDNVQLYYLGANSEYADDAAGIEGVLNSTKAVKSAIFTVNGAQVNKLQKGINILKQTMSDGTVKTIKVIR